MIANILIGMVLTTGLYVIYIAGYVRGSTAMLRHIEQVMNQRRVKTSDLYPEK